jgi:uncharacterized OB-fold protein
MVYCRECGAEIHAQDVFCPECSAHQEEDRTYHFP